MENSETITPANRFRTVLLFGAPGSGKGTQGEILGDIPGFVHVACGEVFRNLRVGSRLGTIFLEYSSRGALVPDDFTVELWRDHIDGMISLHQFDPETDILILDGIPRNVAQARLMEQHIDVLRLYYLDCVDKELNAMRLKRRALRDNRLDDASDAVIRNRLYVYEAETAPVLSYYPEEKVMRIDSGRKPIAVLKEIIDDMELLVGK
jgi:adenylate kinase